MEIKIKNIASDTKGGVALMVGLMVVLILFGILSLTVDLNRTQTSYSKNQDSTNAAALATSEFILKGIIDQIGQNPDPFNWKPTDAEIKKYAEEILKQNFQSNQVSAVYDPNSLQVSYTSKASSGSLGRDYKVTVSACANLDTPLAEAAGHQSATKTCTTSNAGFSLSTDKKVEVALALDYTSSMYCKGATSCLSDANAAARETYTQSKAFKLNETMSYIFDNYFAAQGASPLGIYASVVPFTGAVNLYPYSANFVSPQANLPTLPAPTSYYNDPYLVNHQLSPDFTSGVPAGRYMSFDASLAYILNRIPAIDSAARFNTILNSPNAATFLPLPSFRATLNGLDQIPEYNYAFCYNNAVYGGMDQRIEREQFQNGVTAGGQLLSTGAILTKTNNVVKTKNFNTTTQLYDNFSVPQTLLLTESFPVQPLTNQRDILKNTVARFTTNGAGQMLFPNETYTTPAGGTIDIQSSRLNKTRAFTDSFGTSSVHGLLWAWLTINNTLSGNWWAGQSVSEKYAGGSLASASASSRTDLPSNKNLKHIILITDGNDNDGNVVGTYTNACDAYSPKAKFSDTQYTDLCNKIKSDDVTIHTILFDFTPPAGVNKYQTCASSGEYYANVSPANLQSVIDNIFRDILADIVTVRLINE